MKKRLSLSLFGVIVLAAVIHAAIGIPPIVAAAKDGDRTALRALLARRVDVNAAEADGTTALMWAVQRDDLEAVTALLTAKANANVANRYNVTPLALACTNGNAAIIERLLQAGADPNQTAREGETPLMTAARTGKVEAVKTLLVHGADVNAKEKLRGQTALMWAAAENNAAAATSLVEAHADVNVRSNGGFDALLFATRAGSIETVKVLLDAGANPNDAIQPAAPQGRGGAAAAARPAPGSPAAGRGNAAGGGGNGPANAGARPANDVAQLLAVFNTARAADAPAAVLRRWSSRSRTRITSLRACCSIAAPIRTAMCRAGRRSTRSRGRGSRRFSMGCRRPCRAATSAASTWPKNFSRRAPIRTRGRRTSRTTAPEMF